MEALHTRTSSVSHPLSPRSRSRNSTPSPSPSSSSRGIDEAEAALLTNLTLQALTLEISKIREYTQQLRFKRATLRTLLHRESGSESQESSFDLETLLTIERQISKLDSKLLHWKKHISKLKYLLLMKLALEVEPKEEERSECSPVSVPRSVSNRCNSHRPSLASVSSTSSPSSSVSPSSPRPSPYNPSSSYASPLAFPSSSSPRSWAARRRRNMGSKRNLAVRDCGAGLHIDITESPPEEGLSAKAPTVIEKLEQQILCVGA